MPSTLRPLIVATIMVWVAAYAAWTADWIIQPMPHLLERSLLRVPTCLFGASLCLGIAGCLRCLSSITAGWRAGIAIMLCCAAALVYSVSCSVVFYILIPLWGPISASEALAGALTEAWVFLAWLALFYAIEADAVARDSRLALAEARTAEQRARNQALAQQINPHFLFNALNAVSGLILEGDGKRAERVTMALSNLLRRSLEQRDGELVPLAEEIEAQRRYLEIEQVRFEDRLRFVDAIPDGLMGRLVPPLILQPLIENAVKYGVARSTRPVTIIVTALLDGDILEIRVEDDAKVNEAGVGVVTPGAGIGQKNTRHRAILQFGDSASLSCVKLPDRGYRCILRLPTPT
jgi:LytS/YehU family sensor histidine kinase